MPTNVTREYLDAQERYREARTLEEKIAALKLMLSTVPKHKGTERLRYELKKNLAGKRREFEARSTRKISSRSSFHVPKEGIAQVVLIGPPNSGKSLLLNRLTNAEVKVASYPFTSSKPMPGMMDYVDVQIQLVEMPALVEDVSEGKWLGPKMLSMVRNADAIVIVVDLSQSPVDQLEMILGELKSAGMRLNRREPAVRVKRTDRGGIELEGEIADEDRAYVLGLLQSGGYHNASVVFLERVSREEMEDAFAEGLAYKRAIVLANKGDLPGTESSFEDLRARCEGEFPIFPISAKKGKGVEDIRKEIFESLGVIRVYTKVPGQNPEKKPLVLGSGATVEDLAGNLHKRFISNFRFARIWGASVNFGGEMVGLTHTLADGDVVEVHAR